MNKRDDTNILSDGMMKRRILTNEMMRRATLVKDEEDERVYSLGNECFVTFRRTEADRLFAGNGPESGLEDFWQATGLGETTIRVQGKYNHQAGDTVVYRVSVRLKAGVSAAPCLDSLTRLNDWLPSPRLRKQQRKMLADQQSHIADLYHAAIDASGSHGTAALDGEHVFNGH